MLIRKKGSLTLFLPFLLAILLLSLPKSIGERIQNSIGSHLTATYASLTPHTEQESSLSQELQAWFQDNHESYLIAQQSSDLSFPHLTARVIFRSVHSWSSFMWIDIGSQHNTGKKNPIVCKNSPVLSKDSVVGVIDYVGPSASLVRLITDTHLTPAVRVVRGDTETLHIHKQLIELYKALPLLHLDKDEERKIKEVWLLLQRKLQYNNASQFLAKGELQGHAEPLYRSPGKLLKGIGFNYEWDDAYGAKRPLRSQEEAIIRINDLLVTSGLDGIFPEGLPIARVHAIEPLQEGAFAYDILATPTAYDLLDLRYVQVIAPQTQDTLSYPDNMM